MLYTRKIERLIELSIYASFLKNEKPINLVLIASSESGKTKLMKFFQKCSSVIYSTDVVMMNLTNEILPLIENKEKRTLIIPDLIKVISKKHSTASNFMSMLLPLIEDGISRIDVGKTYQYKRPLTCNLITGITPEEFNAHQRKWKGMGLLTRFLPVTWSYTKKQQRAIRKYIANQKHLDIIERKIRAVKNEKVVRLPPKVAYNFIQFVELYAEQTKELGFRLQERLQCLAKAVALSNKRNYVTKHDVDEVLNLMYHINMNFRELNNDAKEDNNL